MEVHMRADLTIKPEKKSGQPFFVCSGTWAPSPEGLKKGASKFQLRAPAPAEGGSVPPASMKCKGHFFVKRDGQEELSKIAEKNVVLSFTAKVPGAPNEMGEEGGGGEDAGSAAAADDPAVPQYAVEGSGENEYGEFALEGTLKVVKGVGKLRVTKTYDAAHEEEGSEDSEGDEAMDEELDAEELADLRADALELGVQVEDEPPADERRSKKRKAGSSSGGGSGGGSIIAEEEEEEEEEEETAPPRVKKSKQRVVEDEDEESAPPPTAAAVAQGAAAEPAPSTPRALWDLSALQAVRVKVEHVVGDATCPAGDVVAVLDELGSRAVNVELLRASGLGKTVKPLKKHADAAVVAKAAALVKEWRTVIEAETGEK